MSDAEVHDLKDHTGLSFGVLPIRNLEIPLHTKKILQTQCSSTTIDKSKLRFWTVKKLTYAGRLQLVAGITNFWTSSFIIPKSVI